MTIKPMSKQQTDEFGQLLTTAHKAFAELKGYLDALPRQHLAECHAEYCLKHGAPSFFINWNRKR